MKQNNTISQLDRAADRPTLIAVRKKALPRKQTVQANFIVLIEYYR